MRSEIKGVWLVTAKRFVLASHGQEALDAIASHLAPESRGAVLEPVTSAWYPEEVLQGALAGIHREVAKQSDEVYLRMMRECTELGVSRFFRVLLRLSTPGFVLAQVPSMWAHIRRGAGKVTVESTPDGTLVRYREFPYFDDPRYRLLTQGSLQGLMKLTTRQQPRVRLGEFGSDWLDVHVE